MDTYVINLDKDVDKWEEIQKKFSWELTRISAVDGNKCKDRPFFISGFIYGCLQSHRKVWEIVVKTNKLALVLEDDCQPLDGFEERLPLLLQTLPNDYDVAVLGYIASDVRGDYMLTALTAPLMKRRCMKKVNEDWYVPGIFFGTHCYLISPQGAQKLLANRLDYHADFVLSTDKNIQIYCPQETMASQVIQRKPWFRHYNPYITWDWLLTEPLWSFGNLLTVRSYHIILLFLLFIYLSFRSRSVVLQVMLKILVVLLIVHYLSMIVHVSHNLKHGKTHPQKEFNNKQKIYSLLNDAFSYLTCFLLVWIGVRNKILLPMMDVLLLAMLARALIILLFPMKDPSGVCEEKSVSKYSLFEYCGSLRVSGHIMPSIILAYFVPKLGVMFMFIQTFLILLSHSHYPSDVAMGVLIMMLLLYVFQKFIIKKKLQCRQTSKCL